jgi:hypothetical protein
MVIDRKVLVSILIKLKQLSGVNIFEQFSIKESSFSETIFNKKHNIFLTFIQTDFGESITMQIDRKKVFKTEINFLTQKQKQQILAAQRKDSGMLILSGKNSIEKKRTLYSFIEFDVEKKKEIYLLEENILHPINYIKQISVEKVKGIISILSIIFKNFPDVIFVEKISKSIFTMLFNYVSTSKKVFLDNKDEVGEFLKLLIDKKLNRGQIVKNFSLFIEHVDFPKLDDKKKKYFLKNSEIKILNQFLSEEEFSDIFAGENLTEASKKNISEIEF